ncbi:MAG: hypothetical protein ACRDKY_11040 [Solirubrobacteraceae bacterium]
MHTIELTDDELRLLHSALHAYLDDFGHEEADVLREIKALLAKLPTQGRAIDEELTAERLTQLLRDAEREHGAYEKELGRADEDWPTWYAQFILDQLSRD